MPFPRRRCGGGVSKTSTISVAAAPWRVAQLRRTPARFIRAIRRSEGKEVAHSAKVVRLGFVKHARTVFPTPLKEWK
jgi:hypothetical protein